MNKLDLPNSLKVKFPDKNGILYTFIIEKASLYFIFKTCKITIKFSKEVKDVETGGICVKEIKKSGNIFEPSTNFIPLYFKIRDKKELSEVVNNIKSALGISTDEIVKRDFSSSEVKQLVKLKKINNKLRRKGNSLFDENKSILNSFSEVFKSYRKASGKFVHIGSKYIYLIVPLIGFFILSLFYILFLIIGQITHDTLPFSLWEFARFFGILVGDSIILLTLFLIFLAHPIAFIKHSYRKCKRSYLFSSFIILSIGTIAFYPYFFKEVSIPLDKDSKTLLSYKPNLPFLKEKQLNNIKEIKDSLNLMNSSLKESYKIKEIHLFIDSSIRTTKETAGFGLGAYYNQNTKDIYYSFLNLQGFFGDDFKARTIPHEVGHYIWFNKLSKEEKDKFTDLYNKSFKEQKNPTKDDLTNFITKYASSAVEEDYAEMIGSYFGGEKLKKELIEKSKSSSKIKEKLDLIESIVIK